MKNIYKKWEPITGIPREIYLEGLHQDYEGFRLLLRGAEDCARMLRITFHGSLAYRNIDEGDYLETLNPSINGWPLFLVEDSNYLEWFHGESKGIHENEKIVHYAVYTPNDCIDILSAEPPIVEWLS